MQTEKARFNMVKQQIQTWGVNDAQILDLLMTVPREIFVPEKVRSLAFTDQCLDIGHKQKTVTPKEEARILQSLALKPSDIVLEVGCGAGYFTALLAKCTKHVYSVDIVPEFVTHTQEKLNELDITNVSLEVADAASGWEHHAPYDVIVISGSLETIPESFKKSLKPGGRLFAVIGDAPAMKACLLTKVNDKDFKTEILYETVVDRLINAPSRSKFEF